MYVIHEISNEIFWNEKFIEFFDGVLVYGASDPNRFGDRGFTFQLLHGGWMHVHFSTQCGIVESGGVLLWCPTLVRVKNLLNFFSRCSVVL